GGSSGSPVVNRKGQVVALQAGGSFSANTNMFFPLDRVKHAYELIKDGEKVARGTLQTTFKYRSYAELRRLGLSDEQEKNLRKHDSDGQGGLVVDHLLPEGPADGILQPGDILYRLDKRLVSRFIPLEDYLDKHVNETISVTYIRGGQEYTSDVIVGDLSVITPADYLEIGRAVLHNNSYQQARHLNKPIKGVVVATPGYMFGNGGVSSGSVITSINKTPVSNLQDAVEILQAIPNNKEFPVRFYSLRDAHNDSISIVQNQRHWHEANYCQADIESGLWRCQPIADAPPEEKKPVQTATHAKQSNPLAEQVAPSLVWVNFSTPYPVDEIGGGRSFGTGLIIDAEKGLIAVDRSTVPSALGEITLTFAGSVQIPAEVAFIHPLHNLALLQYDPSLLGETLVRSVTLADKPPKEGERVDIVGTNYNYQVLVQNRQVSTYSPLSVNSNGAPKFSDANLMVIATDTSYSHSTGAFLNPKGEISAMIISYGSGRNKRQFWAISVQHLKDMLALYESGAERVYSLEVEWGLVSFVAARRLGMPEEWLTRISKEKPDDHQVLAVNNTWKGTEVAAKLLSGDILLAVDGQLLTSFREVEMATQKETVKLTVARSGEVLDIEVRPTTLSTQGTDRLLIWAGANLQEPHRAIRTQLGITEPGLYVSRQSYGSPAQHFGIRGLIITAVDDQATPNLDAFIAAVKNKQDRESVRLKVLSLSGREQVITLTLSNNYWPMAEVKKVDGQWQRFAIPVNVGE
ncbi:MAG: hypothetical protein HKP09_09165, partial [Enterobacterales bacterium]|nr:hypothetical protein [Enterobacterales bacterium]